MKNILIAFGVVATSVLAFSATFAAQHGQNGCPYRCVATATWHPGDWGGTTCTGSFGISWTRTQNGICPLAECAARPCEGVFTVTATGECANIGATVDTPFGSTVIGGSLYPYTDHYQLDCGDSVNIIWGDIGTHSLTCDGC